MICADREGHQLLQRHPILGINLEKGRGDRCEFQALFHHLRCDEGGRGDLLIALALLTQRCKGTELVQRMQGNALHVLCQRVILSKNV